MATTKKERSDCVGEETELGEINAPITLPSLGAIYVLEEERETSSTGDAENNDVIRKKLENKIIGTFWFFFQF